MRLTITASILCLLAHAFAVSAQDSTRVDTVKSIRILGGRPLLEKKLDRTIVHIDALLSNAGAQAWQVLENIPGVTVDEDGTISLNGKDGILVLIDDHPTYLDGTALVNYLKSLPASTLAQVELLPNPPARYPASGNGIIILRTKRVQESGFHTQLTSSYTQKRFPHTLQSIEVDGRKGPWQMTVWASYQYDRLYFTSHRYRLFFKPDGSTAGDDTQDNTEDSWTQEITGEARIEHKSKRTTFGGIVHIGTTPYHELGHYTDGFFNGNGATDSLTDVRSHFHAASTGLNLNAHLIHTWTHEGRSWSWDADYLHHHSVYFQDEVSTTGPDVYELIDEQPFTARIYSLKTDYTDKFSSIILETGAQETYSIRQNQGSYADGLPSSVTPDASLNNTFRYDEQIRSAYLTLRHEAKNFTFQGGVRMENTWGKGQSTGNMDTTTRLDYVNLFPSFHALWKLNTDGQLIFAYARRIDRPGYGELNPSRFYFDRNVYFSGNAALQPAFSQNFELSYTYRDRYTATASYAVYNGIIQQVFIVEGYSFFYYSINMDRATFARLGIDASMPLPPHWTINLHALGGMEHYRSRLPGNAPLDQSLPFVQVQGNTRYTWTKGWSAEISGAYFSDIRTAQYVLQSYGRINGALRKKLWGDKGSLTLEGTDLFHTWINSRTIYLTGALAHFRNDFYRQGVGLTFTYMFGKKDIRSTEHTSGVEAEKSRL